MCKNPAKRRPGCNISRPSGASVMAESGRLEDLLLAATSGNRATRRWAKRKLKKAQG